MRPASPISSISPSLLLAVSLSLHLFLCLPLLLSLAAPLAAQDEAEEESPYRPGLVATYSAGQTLAKRIDETIAFDWAGAPPDPRLSSGGFQAQWTGRLWTQVAGQHRMGAFVGGGKCRITLGGREILSGEATAPRWIVSDPVELEFDRHALAVLFEKTGDRAQLKLFWTGPGFEMEPVPARFLMHDRGATVSTAFQRGRRLAAALRCGACHKAAASGGELKAPALEKLAGNLHATWLVDWLSQEPAVAGDGRIVRRMPHMALSRDEAADVAGWILKPAADQTGPRRQEQESAKAAEQDSGQKAKRKKKKSDEPAPSPQEGERLFVTLGCLACHQHGELGESGLFGGGDLTKIAAKRPPQFFARWLSDPVSQNRHHRMPIFELSSDERSSLSLWLAQQSVADQHAAVNRPADPAAGQRLVERHRCASCHALAGDSPKKSQPLPPLSALSRWDRSCAGSGNPQAARPGYYLSQDDQEALAAYFSVAKSSAPAAELPVSESARGRDLLVELNCLACHAREGIDRATHSLPATLQEKLAAVVSIHDALGKQVPAMTPPALNSVGDKLHDAALADAILRKGPPHRPYLMVRMPKYSLTEGQLAALTTYFTTTDRIPASNPKSKIQNPKLAAAGPRLVTTDGFGCTSCHQVGSVQPDKAPLNARGPSLSMLDQRIRHDWFTRWCANPARIVPRMEMPSVQIPVRGVLGDNVHDQLAAVWHILNTPGFEPPEPNPVRVLRLSGVPERKEQPIVLHDVVKSGDKTYLFPLVIGLPNRHNVLFDLETNRLAAWWLGDTARQRTKGKSWYWEIGSPSILDSAPSESELSLNAEGAELRPQGNRQFASELQAFGGTIFARKLKFVAANARDNRPLAVDVDVNEILEPLGADATSPAGFRRTISIFGNHRIDQLQFRVANASVAKQGVWNAEKRELSLPTKPPIVVRLVAPNRATFDSSGVITIRATDNQSHHLREHAFRVLPPEHWARWQALIELDYLTVLPADQFPNPSIQFPPENSAKVQIAPAFEGIRLPFSRDIMPSGIGWSPEGQLCFTSLKGQVFRAIDSDDDRVEDSLTAIADGLATPYGLHAETSHIDVAAKNGVVRLMLDENSVSIAQIVAAGWGYTDDYHDWSVGLIRGEHGEYYLGLPCQQDQRSQGAAALRGSLLKLAPRKRGRNEFREFDIEVISSGHRFPMGLACNREGELFVTDNQGNYNPFNELNHVRRGAHFGFINALEKDKGYQPPRHDKPAIDIPHPWTRSVNGICFLDTPQALRDKGQRDFFGPLEGHLIGCEYDTRQLIRMTLQKVGDTYQGAAYPLSIAPENVEDGLLGPIVCAVSPRGELYVGNIRDSGWGAGNNVGDIVQIKIEPDKLPCGIAEVRATKDGFTLDFFRPVDRAKATDAANYSIVSYRREATPAYGGPNLDRRIEKIDVIEVSADAKRVSLRLAGLREGFVYEFQFRPLVRGKEHFHPAEAHYTLNRIPDAPP